MTCALITTAWLYGALAVGAAIGFATAALLMVGRERE